MELDELHVLERRARLVGKGVAVAGVLPAVAGDRVGPTDPSGGQHDRLGPKEPEPAPLAVVRQRSGCAAILGEDAEDGALHVHVDALVDAVVLEGADHLQAGPISHVSQAGILVTPEVALENPAIGGPVEERSPRLQLPNPIRGLPRVELGHAPVVQVLAAAHRVGEMHLPAVALIHVPQGGGHTALGHDRVRLAEQRLADQTHRHSRRGSGDGGPEPRPAGTDDEDVVIEGLVVSHARMSSGLKGFSSRSRSPSSTT